MQVDLTGVDAEQDERVYIKQEGKITLKVVKVTEGVTSNNNPQIKVHFQDRQGRWAIDEFVVTDNALWKLKVFTTALKLQNKIDTQMFIDRYVEATFKAKGTQNGGQIFEIKKYEPSKFTNTYVPQVQVQYQNQNGQNISQQQFHQNTQQQQAHHGQQSLPENPPPIDIDDDEIPF